MIHKLQNMRLKALANVLPKEFVMNEDLTFNSEDEKQLFIKKVGINRRFIAPKNHDVVHYLSQGIPQVLDELSWKAEEIEIFIVVSQSGHGVLPSLAHQLHEKFKFSERAIVWDIHLGCSAWAYALFQVQQLLHSFPMGTKAILCLGDLSSQLINTEDSSANRLFSDAFNILALEKEENASPFYYSFLNPGKGVKSIYKGLDEKSSNGMILNGMEVFQYSVSMVPKFLKEMHKAIQDKVDIQYGVLHQANQLINRSIIKQIDLAHINFLESITSYGNAGIASIGLTIGVNHAEKSLENYILACGFGIGFSIGAVAFPYENPINIIIKI